MKYLTKIATQCDHHSVPDCVTSYFVKFSDNTDDAYTVVCGIDSCHHLFTGNDPTRDMDAVVTNEFDWPVAARFVRLNPQTWADVIALRWEVYGCNSLV